MAKDGDSWSDCQLSAGLPAARCSGHCLVVEDGRRLHSLFGQPVQLLDNFHMKRFLPMSDCVLEVRLKGLCLPGSFMPFLKIGVFAFFSPS